MTITPILLITLLCAVALGWAGHAVFGKPRKRKHFPNGSALQKQPEAVWGEWTADVGKAMRR